MHKILINLPLPAMSPSGLFIGHSFEVSRKRHKEHSIHHCKASKSRQGPPSLHHATEAYGLQRSWRAKAKGNRQRLPSNSIRRPFLMLWRLRREAVSRCKCHLNDSVARSLALPRPGRDQLQSSCPAWSAAFGTPLEDIGTAASLAMAGRAGRRSVLSVHCIIYPILRSFKVRRGGFEQIWTVCPFDLSLALPSETFHHHSCEATSSKGGGIQCSLYALHARLRVVE